jgi:hypothetical protein
MIVSLKTGGFFIKWMECRSPGFAPAIPPDQPQGGFRHTTGGACFPSRTRTSGNCLTPGQPSSHPRPLTIRAEVVSRFPWEALGVPIPPGDPCELHLSLVVGRRCWPSAAALLLKSATARFACAAETGTACRGHFRGGLPWMAGRDLTRHTALP